MAYWRLAFARLTRSRVPGTWRVLGWLDLQNRALWRDAPTLRMRCPWDGCRRDFDLQNVGDRYYYFAGTHHNAVLRKVVIALVRSGDIVADVGGNIGMVSCLMAGITGPTGRVEAFEPNPDCLRVFEKVLHDNGIGNVVIHRLALSDAPGELELTITDHAGLGTLGTIPESQRHLITRQFKVPVGRGDEVLEGRLDRLAFLKIDVEGFESHALRGLQGTLGRFKPLIMSEVWEEYLVRAGSSRRELFDFMVGLGYKAFSPGLHVVSRFREPGLALRPVSDPQDMGDRQTDLVWVHPECPHAERVRPHVRG